MRNTDTDMPLKRAPMMRTAVVCLSAIFSVVAPEAYSADVIFRWDYSASGAAGFALYCGLASRSYTTRIDAGNTDAITLTLPPDAIRFCSVTAYDPAGEESMFSDELAISVLENPDGAKVLPPIRVDGVVVTPTGFRVRFTDPFDSTWFTLYGSQQAAEGPADVTLVGASSGPVHGSVLVDKDNQGFTFVKTGGVLVPDTYLLTIVSRWGSVIDRFNRPLDGDGDGMFGGDYHLTFVVAPTDLPILSIDEFARGPGQTVNLPAGDLGAGIPVRITNGSGVQEVAFTLRYNPALLDVKDVNLAGPITGVLGLKSIDALNGVVQVRVENLSGFTNATTVLLRMQAQVPASAPYGAGHLLDLDGLEFNFGALNGLDDDGLHVVTKLGDATGEGIYSSLDAQRIQRVLLQLDTGFSAFPLIDPAIVGDVNGNGRLDAADVQLIQLKVLRRIVPEIPD
jgi:hypothetical protein